MTLNTQSISSIFRQLAAIAAIVIGAVPSLDLPASVKAPLIAFGGIILAIEHYVSDPSTGSTIPPTGTTAPPK